MDFRFFLPAAFPLLASVVQAQDLPPGVRLGMTADELQGVLPSAERVARPQRLTGGLAGLWRGAPTMLAGLPFEPTFFFAGGALKRIEYVALSQETPDRGAAAFAELVGWGRARFGPELGSSDPGSAYATWSQGDIDVYVQRTLNPQRAAVRLVFKARQLKDGSEL